jgi:hypothetical protein
MPVLANLLWLEQMPVLANLLWFAQMPVLAILLWFEQMPVLAPLLWFEQMPVLAPLPLWERGWGEGSIPAASTFPARDPLRQMRHQPTIGQNDSQKLRHWASHSMRAAGQITHLALR